MIDIKKSIVVLMLLVSTVWAQELNVTAPEPFKGSAFSYNKWHQYFGLAAVGFGTVAGATGMLGMATDPIHKITGQLGAATAVASVASGFLIHFDDINVDFGWTDVDNAHILWGLAGAGLMVAAAQSGSAAFEGVSGHAIMGALGTVTMALSIAIIW